MATYILAVIAVVAVTMAAATDVTLKSGDKTIDVSGKLIPFKLDYVATLDNAKAFESKLEFRTGADRTISAYWCNTGGSTTVASHAALAASDVTKTLTFLVTPTNDVLARMYNNAGIECAVVVKEVADLKKFTIFNFWLQMQPTATDNAVFAHAPSKTYKTPLDIANEHVEKGWWLLWATITIVVGGVIITPVAIYIDNKRHGK